METITVSDGLKSLSTYPVPPMVIATICIDRGVNIFAPLDADMARSNGYLLAKADVLMWLSMAPNISEGGISFTIPDREALVVVGNRLYLTYETAGAKTTTVVYGNKGTKL